MDGASGRRSGLARYDAFVLVAVLWFLAKFLRFAFPALFPVYQSTFDVSNALLGTAFAAMMLVYAAMQFPSGVLADRFGAVRTICGGGVTAAVGALVLWIFTSFASLLVGMILIGFGTGAHKTVSIGLLVRIYPSRTGRALGLFDTFGAFGGVAAPAAVVVAIQVADWHALFLVAGVVGVGFAAGVLRRVPRRLPNRPTGSATGKTVSLGRYGSLFGNRQFALFVAVTVCVGFVHNGVVAFLPLYLVDRGLTSGTASALYGALFAVSFVQIVTGDLSDRVGRLPLTVVVLVVATVALGTLVVLGSGDPLTLGVAVVAFGFGSHGFRPVRDAFLSAVIPDDVSGGGLGLVRTILQGVSALAPAVVGILADASGFTTAFGLLAVVMGSGALLAAVTAFATNGERTPSS